MPPQIGLYLGLCASSSIQTGAISQSFLWMLMGVCWSLKSLPFSLFPSGSGPRWTALPELPSRRGIFFCPFPGPCLQPGPFPICHPPSLLPAVVPGSGNTASLHLGAEALRATATPWGLWEWEQLLKGLLRGFLHVHFYLLKEDREGHSCSPGLSTHCSTSRAH